MPKNSIVTPTGDLCSLNGTVINLHSLEGGAISRDVIKAENTGSDFRVMKHLAAIRIEDFIFETGLNDEVTRVIKGTWNGEYVRSNGSFITANADFKAGYEDLFQNALLTETIIPQCDASSKDAAYFRLRLQPEMLQTKTGDGSDVRLSMGQKQKKILKSNFRFELGKLPCGRIATIDSFSVKLNVNVDQIGTGKIPVKKEATIDFPNLFLTISLADLAPWLEFHKKFVIDGNSSQSDELSGRLVFLAPDLKGELFVISLQGVGIFSLQRHLGQTSGISRFRVGLYCEQMAIES